MQARQMVPNMNKGSWSQDTEEKVIILIKDWLRQIGKTQSELCQSLNLPSSRMPTLIDLLKKDFVTGGIPQIVSRLCDIETLWINTSAASSKKKIKLDNTGQLDLLDEICEDLSKINFNKKDSNEYKK